MGSGDGQKKRPSESICLFRRPFFKSDYQNTARGGRDGSALKSDQLEAALSQGRYIYKERPSEKRVGIFRRPSFFQTIGTGFAA